MRPREELPSRSPIAPGQARLTLEFLRDKLLEKKLQLVGTSILLILLSPEPGCYTGHGQHRSALVEKINKGSGDPNIWLWFAFLAHEK